MLQEEEFIDLAAKAIYGRTDKAWHSNRNTLGVHNAKQAAKRIWDEIEKRDLCIAHGDDLDGG